jgi:hypothetical protein
MTAAHDASRTAYLAHALALYGRNQIEIIADLRDCAQILQREIATWEVAPPNEIGLLSAETTVEGLRHLLGQLRLLSKPDSEVA